MTLNHAYFIVCCGYITWIYAQIFCYSVGSRDLTASKAAAVWTWPLTSIFLRSKEYVDLYLYFPYVHAFIAWTGKTLYLSLMRVTQSRFGMNATPIQVYRVVVRPSHLCFNSSPFSQFSINWTRCPSFTSRLTEALRRVDPVLLPWGATGVECQGYSQKITHPISLSRVNILSCRANDFRKVAFLSLWRIWLILPPILDWICCYYIVHLYDVIQQLYSFHLES